jgi:trk system potassium uptake protein TrkA
MRRLLPAGTLSEWRDPSGQVALAEVAVSPDWIGHPLRVLEQQSGARVALLTRLGKGILPTAETVVQDGDLVHVSMLWEEREHVERVFAKGPSEDEEG